MSAHNSQKHSFQAEVAHKLGEASPIFPRIEMPKVEEKEFKEDLTIENPINKQHFDAVSIKVAFCVCLTLIATVILAKFIGCTLPMFAKKLGFDPAVMASPFITTIVDACSLIIYFNIATILLGI